MVMTEPDTSVGVASRGPMTACVLRNYAGLLSYIDAIREAKPVTMENKNRLSHLDGLRGVAILFVILFHAYIRWPNIVPYGSEFAGIPVFFYGWAGVQLFFMISGFVILMTLERCSNIADFMLRRWLRLFPAMAIATVLVCVTAPLLSDRPAGTIDFKNVVPGLIFIEPGWLNFVFGSHFRALEGPFWSLFVEVKFYFIFGALYFLLGSRRAIAVLFALFAVTAGFKLFMVKHPHAPAAIYWTNFALKRTSAEHFGWFAAGALLFQYYQKRAHGILLCATGAAAISILVFNGSHLSEKVPVALMALLFFTAILNDSVQRVLRAKVFLFLGFVSYPLYLIHEDAVVSLIAQLGRAAPWMPSILLPALPMVGLVAIAWAVSAKGEPLLRDLLKPVVERASSLGRSRTDSARGPDDQAKVTKRLRAH